MWLFHKLINCVASGGGNRMTYNLGRAITYAGLGALFGLLGESLSFVGWQQKISIGTGVLILVFLIFSKG
jgi:sulfite exporter TauE/SafE